MTTTTRRTRYGLKKQLLTLVTALALPVVAFAGATDILSVKDYGAKGDGITDDTTAIQTAITQATSLKKSVFVPGGTYNISATIAVGTTTIIGEGSSPESGQPSSRFFATASGMTMLSCSAGSRLENIGVQGNNTANIGVKLNSGPRIYLTNVEVSRCKKTSFLLAVTQNSCLINCYSSYSAAAYTLANGARNNNFYNCSSTNQTEYYNATAIGVPWANTKLIYNVINTNDTDYGTSVTSNGNDRNNWFGGVHQFAPVAIKWENLSSYADSEGSNNQFYGVTFSTNQILDTQNSIVPGRMMMDSCSFDWQDQSTAFGVGTAGFVRFQGEPTFSGGNNLNGRGITQRSNYAALFVIDSDTYFNVSAYGAGDITLDTTNRLVTINGGDSTVGADFGPASRGNVANAQSMRFVGRPSGLSAILTFTIVSITGSNPVLARLSLDASPWRRTVASCTAPGTYSIPVRIGDNAADTFDVMFSANGNTSCVIKGVSLKACGYPQ